MSFIDTVVWGDAVKFRFMCALKLNGMKFKNLQYILDDHFYIVYIFQ